MSRRPNAATTAATPARTAASSVRSHTTARTPSVSSAGARSKIPTFAPRSRSAATQAAPIPDPPPVTTATRPVNSPMPIPSLIPRTAATVGDRRWQVDAVRAHRGLPEYRGPLRRTEVAGPLLVGAPQIGVRDRGLAGRKAPVHREIAAEHATGRAEDLDRLADDRAQLHHRPGRRHRPQRGKLEHRPRDLRGEPSHAVAPLLPIPRIGRREAGMLQHHRQLWQLAEDL